MQLVVRIMALRAGAVLVKVQHLYNIAAMSSLPYSKISNVFNPADFTSVEGSITFEEADLRYIRQGGPANVSSLMINGQSVDFSSISGVTPGTAANNKALVLGPSGEIGTIASLTATNINGSALSLTSPITGFQTLLSAVNSSSGVSCQIQVGNTETFIGNSSNHNTVIMGNGSRLITCLPGGNIAVGGTTTTYKLGVNGTVNCTNLYRNDTICDLPLIQGISTLGTAVANKALTCNGTFDITGINSLTATSITGTLATGAQTNITSVGTLSSLAVSGSITGTLATAAQPNITSLGQLNGLTSSAPVFITATGTSTGAPVLSCSGSASFGFGNTIFITTTDAARIAYGGIFTCAHRFGDNGLYDFRDTASTLQMYAHTSFLPSRLTNSPSGTAINTATTVYIGGAPIDNGNGWVSIAKPYALYVADGNSYFGGRIESDDSMISTNPVAGQLFSGSLTTSKYNLICRNNAITSGQFAGIAFHNDVGGFTDTTPSAAIVSQRSSATGYEASSIEFYTKSAAAQTSSLSRRMMISKDGLVSIGSLYNGDGILNVLTEGSATMRFGAAITYRDCFSMSYFHNGPNNDLSRLSFSTYGVNSTLSIQHRRRVGINTDAPESTVHVVTSSPALFGTWERVQEWWNDNATPIKAGLIIYNENGGSNSNGISFGTYTNDPINFFVNGSNGMTFNTSKRLNINRTSGPEATVHAGGMIWADELFHSKQNVDGKCVYRSNWSQSNYLGWGTDATVGAMRLGVADANFNWVSYIPVRGGAYTNASDRRIKQDIVDIPYGLAEVMRMQPRKFAMRNDQSQHVGFIAQEILEVIPECVSGAESPDDEMNDSGEPINPMGIDLASLVSVLTKAIQELNIRLTNIEQSG